MVMLLMVFRNPPVDWWSIPLTTRVFTSSVVFFWISEPSTRKFESMGKQVVHPLQRLWC